MAVACRTWVGENLARGNEGENLADLDEGEDGEAFTGRPSSADAIDLLDLVREAEQDARVSASSPDLSRAVERVAEPRISEQYIEVGDEAVDIPPSLPPMRISSSSPEITERMPSAPLRPRISSVPPPPVRASAIRHAENDPGPAMHPALAISLIVGAVIAALYGLLSLPSLL